MMGPHPYLRNDGSPFHARLTASIGVAAAQVHPQLKAATLIEAADQALYYAKREGRNQTWTAELTPAQQWTFLNPIAS